MGIPDSVISSGIDYVANMVTLRPDLFTKDADFRAEVFATLARAHNARANTLLADINPTQLSRHGYLMYAYGMLYL